MHYWFRTLLCSTAAMGLLSVADFGRAIAQSGGDDAWNIFKWLEPSPPRRKPEAGAPEGRSGPVPRGGPVESTDLAPVLGASTNVPPPSQASEGRRSAPGVGVPADPWRGLSLGDVEQLIARLDLPPRSPALQDAWRRILVSPATPPQGADPDHFLAVRLEALYRSGLLEDIEQVAGQERGASAFARVILARKQIGAGEAREACRAVASLAAPGTALRGRLKGEAQLLAGYCAAVAGDAPAAGLAANLAREEGLPDGPALAVLDSLSLGTRGRPASPSRVSLLDYRFLTLLDAHPDLDLVQKAETALLAILAGPGTRDVRVRTAAAEAALRLNAISPEAAAEAYRSVSESHAEKSPAGEPVDPVTRRARLFLAIEATQAPELKGQLLRALLDDARRVGVHLQTARMLVPLLAQLWPSPDTAPLAEPIVEAGIAAGDYDLARRWAETSANLQYWVALVELGQGQTRRGRLPGLAHLETIAARGKLNAEVLHRVSTVVDALDIEVPMAIWEAAGRVPQPTSGYLPETGVLSELQQASQERQVARTVLLAMRAIGPNAAEGASILALGDTIRALRRAGLDKDAQRLGVEALLGVWPRMEGF